MDPTYRERFNAVFDETLYRSYRSDLRERVGTDIGFRLAETPLFLPDELRASLVRAAEQIVAQLSDSKRIEAMARGVPERWNTPGLDALPSFAQVDFAIVRDERGELAPRLIELQGFPSLTAFEVLQRDVWNEHLSRFSGLDRDWSAWFSGLDRSGFLDLARRTIVGDHDPREVVLLDIDPPSQKTVCDFRATKTLFGVDAVDPRELVREGTRLFRHDPSGGTRIPVRRIYNRIVFDELERTPLELPYDYREPLEVEWAPHPNWYWIWSKYSIPFLDHPAVPRSILVSELAELPADVETGWVLKPLFSFAGGGVNVEPQRADVEAIPDEQRPFWVLQKKIEYAPALLAADGGGVKAEIRMMFLRPDDEPRPILGQNLVRLSRGKMHGVDYNKDFTWVGSSVGLFPT